MNTTRTYSMTSRADTVAETRERIARCAMELFFELPYEDVTLAAIGKAAGVSHQTVLNHFESKEGVAVAAMAITTEETTRARTLARPGDVKGIVRAHVGEYERFGDANFRWAATSDRLGSLAVLLDDARANQMRTLEEQFGALLPSAPAARRRALAAVYAAMDVYTWKLLRRDLHMSRADTERVMADLVAAVLHRKGSS